MNLALLRLLTLTDAEGWGEAPWAELGRKGKNSTSIPKTCRCFSCSLWSHWELKLKLGWSWGTQGLLGPSQFKPGCPDLAFKMMVVLLLQEGGGDLWIPHGLRGIRARGFIYQPEIQQRCESNLMLKRSLSGQKLGREWMSQATQKRGKQGMEKKKKIGKNKISRKGKGVEVGFREAVCRAGRAPAVLNSCLLGGPEKETVALRSGTCSGTRRATSRTMAGGTGLE